jgi:hypothetical protein
LKLSNPFTIVMATIGRTITGPSRTSEQEEDSTSVEQQRGLGTTTAASRTAVNVSILFDHFCALQEKSHMRYTRSPIVIGIPPKKTFFVRAKK